MAVYRINPKCLKCGEPIPGIYRDRGDNFVGDTFIAWNWDEHNRVCLKGGSNAMELRRTKATPYDKGFLAYLTGDDVNPFINKTDRDEWQCGYDDSFNNNTNGTRN